MISALTVHPVIVTEVTDYVINETNPTSFTCQTTGEPLPTISWHFNDDMINVSDTNKYRIESRSINTTTTENTLTVYNVTSSDVGSYLCMATNELGSDSSIGVLTVNSKKMFSIIVWSI